MDMEPNEKKQKIEELLRLARAGKMTPEMAAKMAKDKSSQAPTTAPVPDLSAKPPVPPIMASPSPTPPPSHIDLNSIPTLHDVVSPASAPTSPDRPKKYKIPMTEIVSFLFQFTNTNTILDQGMFATRFNVPLSVAQQIVDKLVEKKILKIGHTVDFQNLSKENPTLNDIMTLEEEGNSLATPLVAPSATVAPPVVAPAPVATPAPTPEPKPVTEPRKVTLTTGDLFDFLKKKLSAIETTISVEGVQNEFNIERADAEEIIKNFVSIGVVDTQNNIVGPAALEGAVKRFDPSSVHEFDVRKSPAPVPSSSPSPVAPDIDLTAIHPEPSTVVAGPLPPDATAGERPTSPENNETILKVVNDSVNLLKKLYDNRTKKFIIAALASVAIVAGGSFVKRGTVERIETPPSAGSPDKNKPATATPTPTSPEKNTPQALTPNYEKSVWWTQLNPEVKPAIEKIIKAEDVKSYILPFLEEIEILHEKGSIKPSQKTKEDLLMQMLPINNLMNTVATGNQLDISQCIITAQDESTKVTKTCTVQTNLGRVVKEWKSVRTQALGGHPYQPFSSGTMADDFNALKNELIARANAEAIKK